MTANFTDKSTLPAMRTGAVVWKYKIIYVYKNEPIGNWIAEIAISVLGNV